MALQRYTRLERKTPLGKRGKSDTAKLKDNIQDLLRAIVIIRDGGCVLRGLRHCGGVPGNTGIVLQADHLIERSNGATYADPRLVVCVCKGCHGWKHFKKSNHDHYNHLVRHVLEPERIALWDACEEDSWRPTPMRSHDWAKEAAFLKVKLRALDPAHPLAA